MTDATAPRLYSAEDVAALTGRRPVTIRSLAARKLGIGRKIGTTWVFTDADVEAIRAIDPRGGLPRRDGGPLQYTAGTDHIKDRGPKKTPPPLP